MLKAFKIELDPNDYQKTLFMKNCGAARYAFNFALESKKSAFDKKEKIPSGFDISKKLNILKKTDPKLSLWAYEVGSHSFEYGIENCEKAFENFFRNCKKKIKGKKGFPKFKSRKNNKEKFSTRASISLTGKKGKNVSVGKSHLKIPRIGKIKLKQQDYIPQGTKIRSVTVSSSANRWFASCLCEVDIKPLEPNGKIVGVDLGIKNLATCSDGSIFKNPNFLRKNLKKLKQRQKNLSRKKKGSVNREKAKQKLSKLYFKVENVRKDVLHKTTTKLIRENQTIVLENLSVKNMLKNHNLALVVSDVGFYEFRRQIEYKAKWYGRTVLFADPFFPSSKTCSVCGWKNEELKLSDRVFKCKECNLSLDRDLNAALNLRNLYEIKGTAGSAETDSNENFESKACGDESSFLNESLRISLSEKQEPNIEIRNGFE